MELPVNPFKRALAAGRKQVGLWVALGHPVCAELAAAGGFDWLLIDGEHGVNDVASIMSQLQAVAPYRSHAMVRVPVGDAVTLKRHLDIGAQSLLVPMVDTPQQAHELVEATRYAPAGVRGIATMTRAARWSRVPDYLARAREEIMLIPQIETVKGFDNVDGIAGTDGVDAVFIGPADLAASMGYPGKAGHPEVLGAIDHAFARIKSAGKPAGILTVDETQARKYLQQGFDFVAVGVDVIMLSRAIDALRERFATID